MKFTTCSYFNVLEILLQCKVVVTQIERNNGSGEKAGSYFGSCWPVRGGGMEETGDQCTVVFALIVTELANGKGGRWLLTITPPHTH
jgi:hypothetical protein